MDLQSCARYPWTNSSFRVSSGSFRASAGNSSGYCAGLWRLCAHGMMLYLPPKGCSESLPFRGSSVGIPADGVFLVAMSRSWSAARSESYPSFSTGSFGSISDSERMPSALNCPVDAPAPMVTSLQYSRG